MCENPIHARLLRALPIDFDKIPEYMQKQYTKVHFWKPSIHTYDIPLPCGYCLECRLNKSKQFAIRCMAEKKMHSKSCFVTLTYNDKHLPKTKNGLNTVREDEIQKFFKKLLKKYPNCNIRRFYSCEYGYTGTRKYNGGNPHYHAIIFGYKPNDLVYYKKGKNGDIVYKSKELQKIWGKGFVTVGEVTVESAGYTSRYTMKKAGIKPPKKKKIGINPYYHEELYKKIENITDPEEIYQKSKKIRVKKWLYEKEIEFWIDGRIDDREPERLITSRRPGIGHPYWEAHFEEIKKNEGFYVKTSKGVKLMPIAKAWCQKWKESEDKENYYKYWWKKQIEFEQIKENELKNHPGFTWEELQKQRYESLRKRTLALKRNEDFYCQQY